MNWLQTPLKYHVVSLLLDHVTDWWSGMWQSHLEGIPNNLFLFDANFTLNKIAPFLWLVYNTSIEVFLILQSLEECDT